MAYPLHHKSCNTQSRNDLKLYLFHFRKLLKTPAPGLQFRIGGGQGVTQSMQAPIRTGFPVEWNSSWFGTIHLYSQKRTILRSPSNMFSKEVAIS